MDYVTSGRSGQSYQVGQPIAAYGAQFYRGYHGTQEVVLRLVGTDPASTATLRAEAALLDRLDHQHVARLLDRGRNDQHFFLALEGPAERSLAELIDQSDLAPTASLDIVLQVLDILDVLHGAGVAWGRLRPQAFWVDKAGKLKLFDVQHAGEPITSATLTLPEATYLAPEQTPSVRGDLYACGALAYEVLAGRLPFVGGDMTELAVKHLSEPTPDLGRVAPDLPAELVKLVTRCLAKSPDERPDSARELHSAFAAIHDQLVAAEQARMITCPRCQGRVLPAERCPLCNAPLVAKTIPAPRRKLKLLPLLAIGISVLAVLFMVMNLLGGQDAAASPLPTVGPTAAPAPTTQAAPTALPTPLPTAAAPAEAAGTVAVAADDVADPNIDLIRAQVAVDPKAILAELQVAGKIDVQPNESTYQLFFDTDSNRATGDHSAPWPQFGADYTVLYRSGDAAGMVLRWDGASWQGVGAATTTIDGGQIQFTIPAAWLGSPNTLRYAAMTTKPGPNLADFAPVRSAAGVIATSK